MLKTNKDDGTAEVIHTLKPKSSDKPTCSQSVLCVSMEDFEDLKASMETEEPMNSAARAPALVEVTRGQSPWRRAQ